MHRRNSLNFQQENNRKKSLKTNIEDLDFGKCKK